jgi:hypothetical protein
VAHHRPRLAQRYLGPELELERLARVVQDRRRHEQVRVQPWVQDAGLEGERRDRDGVLDETAQVGVVPGACARRPPEVRPEPLVIEERLEQCAQVGGVDLAGEMLEEAVELLHVAVGHREELGGVGPVLRGTLDRLQVDLKRVSEALDATPHGDEIAAFELSREEVRVPERPPRNRARAIAQLDRQVGRAVPRCEAVLARAREDPVHLAACSQLSDRHASNRDRRIGRRVR